MLRSEWRITSSSSQKSDGCFRIGYLTAMDMAQWRLGGQSFEIRFLKLPGYMFYLFAYYWLVIPKK